jgi:hypothetical protein
MTTTSPTITARVTDAGARVHPAGSATDIGIGVRMLAALRRFAVRGQMGADTERERGRRTGARA